MMVIKSWEIHDPETWDITDVNDTSYAAFVYLITFPDGDYYIGMKQIYKGIKDINDLKTTSKEADWMKYYSSSKTVQARIEEGEDYNKYILWCFPTTNQAALIEAMLIGTVGMKCNCLNKAIMTKSRLPKPGERAGLFKTFQYLYERLS